MHNIVCFLACLACTCHGRRLHSSPKRIADNIVSLQAFAKFLRLSDSAAAFNPSISGVKHPICGVAPVSLRNSPLCMKYEYRRPAGYVWANDKIFHEMWFRETFKSNFEEVWNASNYLGEYVAPEELTIGEEITGIVNEIKDWGVWVGCGTLWSARLRKEFMDPELVWSTWESFYLGQKITARIRDIDVETNYIELTMQSDEHVGMKGSQLYRNPAGAPMDSFKVGQVVEGPIVHLRKDNLLVDIGAEVPACVFADALYDVPGVEEDASIDFRQDFKEGGPGQVVIGRIREIDKREGLIILSALDEEG